MPCIHLSLSLSVYLCRVCCITTRCRYHGNYGEQKDKLFYICCYSLKFWQMWWWCSCCDVSLLVSTTEKLSDGHTHRRMASSDLIKAHTHTQSLSYVQWCRTPTVSTHFLSFIIPPSSICANITTATRRLHWCHPWGCQSDSKTNCDSSDSHRITS